MNKLIRIILCHECGTSFERDMIYRACSNCFACTACEIYICPECAAEIIVNPKTEANDPEKHNKNSRS